jgi:hypothetical protein
MPQPLNRVVPNATVSLTPDALTDKPDMAIVVTQIFAMWAHLEQALAIVFIRLVGGDQEVAHALYSMLQTETLRQAALLATAKAKLSTADNDVLVAMINVATRVATPRNQLAHWPWAVCTERPDLLLLVNPKFIRDIELRKSKLYSPKSTVSGIEAFDEMIAVQTFDPSEIQTYGIADLKRSLRDIEEAHTVLSFAIKLLDANSIAQVCRDEPDGQAIRAQLLQQLNEQRLFREAAGAKPIDKGQTSNPLKTSG